MYVPARACLNLPPSAGHIMHLSSPCVVCRAYSEIIRSPVLLHDSRSYLGFRVRFRSVSFGEGLGSRSGEGVSQRQGYV